MNILNSGYKRERTHQAKHLIAEFASIALMTILQTAVADVPKQLGNQATAQLLDQPIILNAPVSDSKRVYVLDPGHFHVTSTIYTVDGKTTELLGMTDAGKLPHVLLGDNGKFMAVINTLWSRIATGTHDDYIEILDTSTHDVITEIDIPEGRFLTAVFEHMATLSTDDKHLLFQQFSPSPAVGLVDLEKKSFVKMMATPDCYHLFPVPDQSFFMHCRDGSMLQVKYDAEGNTTQTTSKVFHPEDQYLLNSPFYSDVTGRLVWPTYDGRVYQANLKPSGAEFLDTFEVFTDKERAENWRPGGWQIVAYHNERNEIYLLADQREKWTHKLPSRFVFVVDGTTGERLRRIELKHEIDSITVSQDATPYLYAVSATDKSLYTFDAITGKQLGVLDELGVAPLLVFIPQE